MVIVTSVLDAESVHAVAGVPAESAGRDAVKEVPGRRHGLAVDVLGLVIAVVAVPVSAHENAVGIALLGRVAADTDAVGKALVGQGFENAVVARGGKVGIGVEVVERDPAQTGCVPRARRWVMERAYGVLMLHRRLVRDYGHLPAVRSRGCTGR
ncbi:hypothetical protein ACIOKD_40630 [Streptomyces sp. NPDC087844]|uniref:hypothetical protein n=1 Tax=Streptomyces sp. NPDC087844 TaxID=3365805 RepID=UPI0037F73F26